MDIEEKYGFDEDVAKQGVWFNVGDGARLRIAMEGNDAYTNYVRKKVDTRGLRSQLQAGNVDVDQISEIQMEAKARHILVDWENIEDDGEELEYSPENARYLMEEYPKFEELVDSFSQNSQNFRKDEDIKNSDDG